MKRKVLVIGSESFVGKHLLSTLLTQSDLDLSVLYRNIHPDRVKLYETHQVKTYSGDLEDYNTLLSLEAEYDLVYYLISATYPAASWANPKIEVGKNLTPFFNFMRFASVKKVKRIAYISSGGTVYGLQKGRLTEDVLTMPFSPYGIFKLTMERLLEYLSIKENIPHDIYRISNIYGPGQNISKGLGVINIWLKKIIDEKKITIFGDGENVRDYIYVKDVAELLLLSLKRTGKSSETFNMGANASYSLNELIDKMKNIVPFDFETAYIEGRKSDNKHVVINADKLIKHFGPYEFTTIEEGIQLTYQSYTNNTVIS